MTHELKEGAIDVPYFHVGFIKSKDCNCMDLHLECPVFGTLFPLCPDGRPRTRLIAHLRMESVREYAAALNAFIEEQDKIAGLK